MNTFTSTIQLEGVDDLMAMLRVALVYHKETDVRKALAKGGKIIIDAAKSNVQHNITGTLRDSIKVMPKWPKDPMAIYVGPRVRRTSRRTAQRLAKTQGVKVDAFYAAMVEYGTAAHNLGFKGRFVEVKGAKHPGARPKPYMRPAYDAFGQQALDASMAAVWKMIEDKVSRSTISNIAGHTSRGGRRLY